MSKRIGNYVGFSTFLEAAGGNKGVWNLIEQFYFRGKGGWVFSATGGTVTTAAGKTIHTFTSSGTFTVTSGFGDVEYLVVAGGGVVVDTSQVVVVVLVDIEPLQVPLAVVVVLNLYFQYLLDLIQLLLVVVVAQQLRRLPETGVMGTTLPSLESSLPPVVVVAVVDTTVKWADRAVAQAVMVASVHQEPHSRVSPAD